MRYTNLLTYLRSFGRQTFGRQTCWATDILGDIIFMFSVLLSPLATGDDTSL